MTLRTATAWLIMLAIGALASAAEHQPSPPARAAAVSPAAGEVWREALTGMEFVFVPGSTYEQGCGDWVGDCPSDARPPRKVKLSGFWIGKYEVTQGQWKTVVGVNPAQQRPGEAYPVERVSWIQVQDFIKRLNSESGNGKFRLPTEAEWEYACRAGGKRQAYGTADGKLDRKSANYGTDTCCGRDASDGYSEPSRVGTYAPNALGLYDLTGNLWEWVQDTYDGSTYLSGRVTNPLKEDSGPTRITRGGSVTSSPGIARCTDRRGIDPEARFSDLGFRLVRIVEGKGRPSRPAAAPPSPSIPKAEEPQAPAAEQPPAPAKPQVDRGVPLERCC